MVAVLDDEFTVCEETLLIAFNYAIGRKSYVVTNVVRDLQQNAELMSSACRQRMIESIETHRQQSNLGSDIDRLHWLRLLQQLQEIEEEQLP